MAKRDARTLNAKSNSLGISKFLSMESVVRGLAADVIHTVQSGSADLDLANLYLKLLGLGFPKLTFRQGEKKSVPVAGPLVFVANYPLGALEVIALYHLLSSVRSDLKVVNCSVTEGLDVLFDVTFDAKREPSSEEGRADIEQHLQSGGALLVFPAVRISRLEIANLKDGRWRTSFIDYAENSRATILPVYMDIRYFLRFYSIALATRPVSRIPWLRRAVRPESTTLSLRLGAPITHACYQRIALAKQAKAKLFRKELYRTARGKSSLFKNAQHIDGPQDKAVLERELDDCELLGQSSDGMKIYLYNCREDDAIIYEIGRLREESFRMIGEGTGEASDIDVFDRHYFHIILWDPNGREIAGAYRLKPTADTDITAQENLYTQTLFDYLPNATTILCQGLELGRSFVQPKYWGSRSLDYLWVGIAAFLRNRPQFRYLLGAVSISDTFSKEAKDMMVYYYQQYYGASDSIVSCQRPYVIDSESLAGLQAFFNGLNAKEGFVALKQRLAQMSFGVPVLYKQYTGLCDEGGVLFHGFNVDPDFNDCIDGLVVVDIDRLLPNKRKRYGLLDYRVE